MKQLSITCRLSCELLVLKNFKILSMLFISLQLAFIRSLGHQDSSTLNNLCCCLCSSPEGNVLFFHLLCLSNKLSELSELLQNLCLYCEPLVTWWGFSELMPFGMVSFAELMPIGMSSSPELVPSG